MFNFKYPALNIKIEDIPQKALELYKRDMSILSYKRDIEEIVQWLVINNNY